LGKLKIAGTKSEIEFGIGGNVKRKKVFYPRKKKTDEKKTDGKNRLLKKTGLSEGLNCEKTGEGCAPFIEFLSVPHDS